MKIKELVAFLPVKTRQIENLVNDGLPRAKVGRCWDYGPDAVIWYYTDGPGRPAQPVGVEAARARKENAQAEMAEYQLAQIQGKMLSIDFHQEEKNRVYDRIRAKLLNFPGWMAPRVAGRKMGEVQKALEDGVNEILEVLSMGDDADTNAPKRTRKRKAKGRGGRKKTPSPAAKT